MTKYFCDRCKKEVEWKDKTIIGTTAKFDLCLDCHKDYTRLQDNMFETSIEADRLFLGGKDPIVEVRVNGAR